MRKKTDLSDLDGYCVKVTRDAPASEEGIPLADFLQLISPAAVGQPTEAALLAKVDALIAERMAQMQQPQPPPVEPEPADLPAFMQRMQRPHGAAAPIPDLTVDDAIAAVNEIESRLMDRIEGLARRLDEVSAKLDMEPVDYAPADHAAAVETLTNWLRTIEQRANDAMAMAARASEVQPAPPTPEPVAECDPPVVESRRLSPRDSAIERVKQAAADKRAAHIGESADHRDTLQRMVEIALNARAANGMAITRMEALASAQGRPWDDLSKEIIAMHDAYTDLTVRTRIIELIAVADITMSPASAYEAIVDKALNDIGRIGAP